MPKIKDIVDEEKINKLLDVTKNPTRHKVLSVLKKAAKKKGLSLSDVAYLVNTSDPTLIDEMFKISSKIKDEIYGERLVLFAPLYVSSYCVNDCAYCGFHKSNKAPRKKLTLEEVGEQVKILEDMGHKRLLLEFGEDPKMNPIDYIVDVIKKVYETKSDKGEIRRVNVNIAATSVENYQELKKAGIGTYQLFQETYHQNTYKKLHKGLKADYERQLFAHNNALKAGIDDIGLGVLFGLYDPRFEVLALISHAQYLDTTFGIGPHTFSVPRWRPAPDVNFTKAPYPVTESDLLKIISILRMAIPYTGMIISTRERPEVREKSFRIGISQTSAASNASPGGYGKDRELSQFEIQDHRSMEKVIQSILKQDLLPSFCTACYRQDRTGKSFMNFAKSGSIQNLCRPNGILTFKEYLEDYAGKETKNLGTKIIEKYLKQISDPRVRIETKKRLLMISKGERDLFF